MARVEALRALPLGLKGCATAQEPRALKEIVPLKYIEHGVYEDLIIIYPEPYSI